MAYVEIDADGSKTYYNNKNEYHREDGPAMINNDGSIQYWIRHRPMNSYPNNWPDIHSDGIRYWYDEQRLHSINRPCEDYPSGLKLWYDKGNPIWPTLK